MRPTRLLLIAALLALAVLLLGRGAEWLGDVVGDRTGLGRGAPAPLAGMVAVAACRATVGSTEAERERWLAGRPDEIRRLFAYEDRHEVTLAPYQIGRFEVTGAQYARFLADRTVEHTVTAAGPRTARAIAAALTGLPAEVANRPDLPLPRQLVRANLEAIREALHAAGDEPQALVDAELPAGLVLRFPRLLPPADWPDLRPAPGEEDRPVRYVRYDDAEAFAAWAGCRLPTESEWEWAARGPGRPTFPWGDDWHDDASRANWHGLVRGPDGTPALLPVDALPAGASWCGCEQMAGNVGEWTGSWFEAYPGSAATHAFMGRWVKVIRGGGAGDAEPLVMRAACRNFVGAGPDAPPYPENSFQWVGFRLAASESPAADRLGPVVRRATQDSGLREDALRRDLDGLATRPWVLDASEAPHHVYALGGSRAILVLPCRTAVPEHSSLLRAARRVRDAQDLQDLARTQAFVLGVLHTDLPLRDDGAGGAAAGTWLVVVDAQGLALREPGGDGIVPLEGRPPGPALLVTDASDEGLPVTRLTPDPGGDAVRVSFALHLAQPDPRAPARRVTVDFTLRFEPGALGDLAAWIPHRRAP